MPAQGISRLDRLTSLDVEPSDPKTPTTLVRAAGGGALVAKVLCELGKSRLIKLPTGELDVVARKDTRPTDKPFKSATRKQIAAKIKADGFTDFKFASGGYYVYAYDSSEAYYLHTRSILESMLSGVVAQLKDWGLEPQRPETPLVVMIVGSRSSFDAIREMPPEVAAYYDGITNRVVLYEDQRLWEAAPEYAFKQAAYTVAHEGIHQLLANTGIQQRLSHWPQWISEGLPEYFCPLKVNTKLIKKKDSQLPERTLRWSQAGRVNDLRMYDLLRSTSRNGILMRDAVQATNLTSYGYAVSWGMVHYLATEKPETLGAYLKEVQKSKPLERSQYRGRPDPLFIKHFGDKYAVLERRVQTHLLSKPMQRQYKDPIERQTHYLMKQIVKRGRTFHTRVAITLSPAAAKEWKEEQEALIEAEGRTSQFYTIVCKTRKEVDYHLAKLGLQIRD